MLNLFSVGLITEQDLMVWQPMVVEVTEARRRSNSFLSRDVEWTSRRMTWILRHGANEKPAIRNSMRPGGGIPLEELVDNHEALAGTRAQRTENQYGPLSRYLFIFAII